MTRWRSLCGITAMLAVAGCSAAPAAPPGPGGAGGPLGALTAHTETAAWVTIEEVEVRLDSHAPHLPFTWVTAVVDVPVKGRATAGDRLQWRLVGGTIGERSVRLHDAPAFAAGEKALVLLTEPGAAGWPKLVGLGAGKWKRHGDAASPLLRAHTGLNVAEGALVAALSGGGGEGAVAGYRGMVLP